MAAGTGTTPSENAAAAAAVDSTWTWYLAQTGSIDENENQIDDTKRKGSWAKATIYFKVNALLLPAMPLISLSSQAAGHCYYHGSEANMYRSVRYSHSSGVAAVRF